MPKQKIALSLAMLLMLVAGMLPAGRSFAQGNSRTFTETGFTVSGKFLDYWNAHGGLAVQGLPLSEPMDAVSPTDGKTYTTQYFERTVLEMHPENAGTPFEVLGSLIGSFYYHEHYLLGGTDEKASTSNPYKFDATGMTVGGRFRQYWEQNGGLAQFGYPISNEFQEKSALDGKMYTVQYFERASFELHPENSAPNDVLLAQLGKFQHDEATSLTFTDATGTTVTLPKHPERIVTLFSLPEDILYTLGVDPVAVSDTFGQRPDFWGDHAKEFGRITGGFAAPNLEDIAKFKPDLVIGFLPHIGLRDSLKNIAPLYIMNPALYQDSVAYESKMGYLLNRPYQARLAIEGFGHKMQSYKAAAPNDQLPLILFGADTNFAIMTAGSLFGSVLAAVTNYPWAPPGPNDVMAPDQEPGSLQYSLEKVLEKDPDVLLIETRGGGPKLSAQLSANPIWSELKAVKNNRAFDVDFSLYVGGRGMRSLGLALDDAMMKIYPDKFKTPLP